MGPKAIRIMHLELMRNELDDGDAILIAEILFQEFFLKMGLHIVQLVLEKCCMKIKDKQIFFALMIKSKYK
jgi:hypothetical protein